MLKSRASRNELETLEEIDDLEAPRPAAAPSLLCPPQPWKGTLCASRTAWTAPARQLRDPATEDIRRLREIAEHRPGALRRPASRCGAGF